MYNMFVMFNDYIDEVSVVSMLVAFGVKVTRKGRGYEILACTNEQKDIILEKASRVWPF